jgi:hypothetical protein
MNAHERLKEETIVEHPQPPETKAPGRNGFKYRPKFGVVVLCTDERHHVEVYEALRRQGYRCKVVAV